MKLCGCSTILSQRCIDCFIRSWLHSFSTAVHKNEQEQGYLQLKNPYARRERTFQDIDWSQKHVVDWIYLFK